MQVLFLFASQTRRLHTTRSWGFLGLEVGAGESEDENIPPNSLWRKENFGKDVIIGNLDTGSPLEITLCTKMNSFGL
jgi:hypothetical protein